MSLMIKQIIRSTRPGKDVSEPQSAEQCSTTYLMTLRCCALNQDIAISAGEAALLYLLPLCRIKRSFTPGAPWVLVHHSVRAAAVVLHVNVGWRNSQE